VKEKLDEEANQMQNQKKAMLEVQQQLLDQKHKEKQDQDKCRLLDMSRKQRDLEE